MFTWLRTVRALSLGALVFTATWLGAQAPGLVVQPRVLEPQDWITFGSVELYRTAEGPVLLVRARSALAFGYSAFDPPGGKLWSVQGTLPSGDVRFLVPLSGLPGAAEGMTLLCRPSDTGSGGRTGFFLPQGALDASGAPMLPAGLALSPTAPTSVAAPDSPPAPDRPPFDFFAEREKALDPLRARPGETPRDFLARHPWFRPDSVAVTNPDHRPDQFFSPRFRIRDKVDLPFRPDPRLTGTWKYLFAVEPHGVEDGRYVVHVPGGPLDLAWFQSLTVLPSEPVYPSKDVTWRGIRLGPRGSVEVDVGSVKGWRTIADFGERWTSGWVLSTKEAIASELFFSSDDRRDLLWLAIKGGDSWLGLPPSWVVFFRDRPR